MRITLIAYVSTLFVYFGLDFIWLWLTSNSVYKAHIGKLMLDKPVLPVAAAFYTFYVVALTVFAVLPALSQGGWVKALWAGALLGFTAYGAYDLTNQATLAGWSSFVTIVDMGWGTFAGATAAIAGYFLTRALA
jgi:uncharacterized membrane protein